MRHPFYLIPLVLAASGCGRAPDIYQPPIDRKPLMGPEAHLGGFVNMNDAGAEAYLARDISHTLEQGTWRWAYRHPQLRFYLRGIDKLRFLADLGISPTTFQETGPVALAIRINDHDFTTERFDKPGERRLDKPVPAAFLISNAENFVSFEADKQWVSKEDGAVLTFVLSRAGFIR